MTKVEYGNISFDLDEEGYLVNTDDWSDKIACGIAEREGVDELTDDKMEIIRFMRSYYKKYNFFPILRFVCKNLHKQRECVTEEFIDPLKAWKIAGLPKPSDQVVGDLKGEGGVT